MTTRWTTRPGLLSLATALALAGCNTDDKTVPDGPCPNGICVNTGDDAGATGGPDAATDPCDGVACNTPPSQCHAASGTCNAGTCEYALAPGQACNDGNACTDNDMCDAAGACAGTARACTTPPAAACADADTSVVYDMQGSCQMGACQYTSQQVSCPGMCGAVDPGLCPNPCEGRTCDTPPTECYATPGTCDPQTGACSYTVDGNATTCDDGDPCTTADACQADGSCLGAGVVCDMAPPPTCMGNTLRTYTAMNAACDPQTSMCDYPSSDMDCGAAGCSNGACNQGCMESTCSAWALPSTPNGTAVRTCTDANCPTTATLPALDENRYRCQVQPILDSGCAFMGCHSTHTPNRRLQIYSIGLDRILPIIPGTDHDGPLNTRWCNTRMGQAEADCDANPLTVAEWQHNYDMARLFALDAQSAANNELVTQPLAADPLGQAHDGFDIWGSTADVRYQAVIDWLNGQTSPANCNNLTIPTRLNQPAATLNNYGGQCPDCTDDNQQYGCPGLPPPNNMSPCDPTQCVR